MKKALSITALVFMTTFSIGQPPLVQKIEQEFKHTKSYYLYESVIRAMFNLIDDEEISNLPGAIEMIVSVEIKGDSAKEHFKTVQNFIANENMEVFMELSNVNIGKDFLGLGGMTLSDGQIKRLKVFADEGDAQVERIILLMRSAQSVNFISIKGQIDLDAIPSFLNKIKSPSKLFKAE